MLNSNFELFSTFPRMPWWYVPFVFLPGMLFLAIAAYVLVERPGINPRQAAGLSQSGFARRHGTGTSSRREAASLRFLVEHL